MKKFVTVTLIICCITVFAYLLTKKNHNSNIVENQALVASVKAVPIQTKTLSKHIIVYGIVESVPDKVKTITLSFDAVIDKMFVTIGQNVKKGQVLFGVIPSLSAKSQLMQAKNALTLSEKNLKFAEEKFKMHLLTQQDILNAQNAYNQAKIVYDNLRSAYADRILSPIDGVVTKINYTEGSHVINGSPILEISSTKDTVIKCGVEPEDIGYLKIGMPVSISLIDYNKKISGKITFISNVIDPSTHQINVYVIGDSNEQLLLNSYAQISIPIFQHTGLTVPRSALLSENGHYIIYTVKNGLARKHVVDVIIKNQEYAQIAPCNISEHELVVTKGAYELKDNMKVKVEK